MIFHHVQKNGQPQFELNNEASIDEINLSAVKREGFMVVRFGRLFLRSSLLQLQLYRL